MFKNQQIAIAYSIFFGLALVAASLFFSGRSLSSIPLLGFFDQQAHGQVSLERVDKNLRIEYGNPKAATKIIEFADFQCPYCSLLHSTLKQLVDESNGTVVWEYRHFPLPIHPNALSSAHYAECVFALSGTESFWKYADILMKNQGSLAQNFLTSSAQSVGVDAAKLAACVSDQKMQQRVTADEQAAQALGGSGTPFSIIEFPDGSKKQVSGALPYMQWKTLLGNKT